MNAFIHHLNYDFRTGLRNKSLMLMNYLLPLFFYAMMGAVMGNINPEFKKFMIPAMIVFAILSATILGLPNPLVSARESGIFRSYKINGVPSYNILIIPMVGTILHLVVCSLIIALTAGPLFGAGRPLAGSEFQFIGVFLMSAFSMGAIGLLIGVVASDSRATILLSQAIYLPSMMHGGLMMPLSAIPSSVQTASLMFPATYAMEAFRSLAMGLPSRIDPVVSILTLFVSGMIALGLAIYLFNWDSKSTGKSRPRLLALLALVPYAAAAIFLSIK